VIDRCSKDYIAALDRALAGRPRITLDQCIRAIVDVVLVSHEVAPDLHRIVIDLAPRIGVAEKTERMSRKMADAIEAVLRMHADQIAAEIDLATAATLIETLLVALAHRASRREEEVAEEATRMITRDLAGAAGGNAGCCAPVLPSGETPWPTTATISRPKPARSRPT
jgi:hypothetical protein